ncbi:hypothetical protein VTK56DRAFT_3312 [Thermocarpiscus australiensis]
MASFDTLHERLTALQETTGQLRELIGRLANIEFRPGSVPLSTSDEDNVAAELGAEISQILREEEEDLELLNEEIIDLRSGRPGSEAEHRKTRLKQGAQRLEAELRDCRTAFRKAQLSARRSLEAAQKLERELLLSSYAASISASTTLSDASTTTDNTTNPSQTRSGASSPTTLSQDHPSHPQESRNQLFTPRDRRRLLRHHHHHHHSSPQSDLVTASSDVTLALRRTHALIAGEVAKSAFAAQTLAESTAALAELQRGYEGLHGLLARSRDLVGELVRAQKSDTWYLRAALRVLLATLAWLVFRRFLYGPLWWLVWLPLRTGWTAGSRAVSGGLGGRHQQQQQQQGRMQVTRPGEVHGVVVVGVGEDGAVPTIQIGTGLETETPGVGDADHPDSMVERVGRMVEDTLDRKGVSIEEEANSTGNEEALPNPKKRMWEEQVRDEL